MSLPSNELSETELDALIARERTRVFAPLTDWHTLSAQLSAEGMLRSQSESSPATADPLPQGMPSSRGRFRHWGMRVVASVALVGIGVVVGRGIPVARVSAPAATPAVAVAPNSTMPFESSEQAQKVLAHSRNQYQRAVTYLAEHDTSARIVGGAAMYQERLAALDEVVATTRAQVEAAPDDPLLKQYYQSAVGARKVTMQQLGEVLPAGVRIAHY